MSLEESELLDHVSGDSVEIEEFNVFGGIAPSRSEEPFILGLNEDSMFWLVHGWKEDCRIAVVCNPGWQGFV